MTLYDRIIDEAEELAYNRVPSLDASDHDIIDAVSDIVMPVGVRLGYNSTGGRLALAAYHRTRDMVEA